MEILTNDKSHGKKPDKFSLNDNMGVEKGNQCILGNQRVKCNLTYVCTAGSAADCGQCLQLSIAAVRPL